MEASMKAIRLGFLVSFPWLIEYSPARMAALSRRHFRVCGDACQWKPPNPGARTSEKSKKTPLMTIVIFGEWSHNSWQERQQRG